MLVPKLLLTPLKIRIFGPKTAKFGPNMHFGHFRPNIGIFLPFLSMPDQKTMRTTCLGGFSKMWVTKLLISPLKIRIFSPKTTKFLPEIGIFGHFWARLIWCPVGGLVGGFWRTGCISQDTYLLYLSNKYEEKMISHDFDYKQDPG